MYDVKLINEQSEVFDWISIIIIFFVLLIFIIAIPMCLVLFIHLECTSLSKMCTIKQVDRSWTDYVNFLSWTTHNGISKQYINVEDAAMRHLL